MGLNIYESLCAVAGTEHVLCSEPMSRHTTFRTGGEAEFLVSPDMAALPRLISFCQKAGVPFLVIGNGSNLLAGDAGIDGVVIEIGKRMSGITIERETVTAGAGALLSSVAAASAAAGLTGLEFASGIPGSIGGAVVMNAGAYGGEIADVLLYADVLCPDGEISRLTARELDFSYRHSIVPEQGYIVLNAAFRLRAGEPRQIYSYMEELKNRRLSKQPLEYPSAGSTFKRPQGHFAGALIEQAGLRGLRVGGAQVSEKHCGFVINTGQATSADIRRLMEQIQARVWEQFQVRLEPEVRFVGKFR